MQENKTESKDRVCPWWFSGVLDNPLRRWLHKPQAILEPYVRPGQTALDIGCGPGYFTLPLARLVGEQGQVIAVDLQQQMLEQARRRADQAGLLPRIRFQQASPGGLGLEPGCADFALAFWMVHEVPDKLGLLRQVRDALRPGGRLLLVEPLLEVQRGDFEHTLEIALGAGLQVLSRPQVRISRAALFE